jgi:hypothetical protein
MRIVSGGDDMQAGRGPRMRWAAQCQIARGTGADQRAKMTVGVVTGSGASVSYGGEGGRTEGRRQPLASLATLGWSLGTPRRSIASRRCRTAHHSISDCWTGQVVASAQGLGVWCACACFHSSLPCSPFHHLFVPFPRPPLPRLLPSLSRLHWHTAQSSFARSPHAKPETRNSRPASSRGGAQRTGGGKGRRGTGEQGWRADLVLRLVFEDFFSHCRSRTAQTRHTDASAADAGCAQLRLAWSFGITADSRQRARRRTTVGREGGGRRKRSECG